MAQQINLCAPILLTQKKYFSAHTMAASLGVFVVLGAVLAGTWAWNLGSAARQYTQTMESQARDIDNLKSALERIKAAAQPVDPGLTHQLEDRRAHLEQRKALLAALQDGASEPGNGYAARLQFLASSTPASVWINGVTMSAGLFRVSGYTLEPAALNDWVARMATHPLLQGLQLSQVQVKAIAPAAVAPVSPAAPTAPPLQPAAVGRKLWSFELGSTRPMSVPKTNDVERKP
ncbi:PilN domain-containing protein [Curvibacter sp. APW13]|uniref:PilN domain-containing protein n=1 Tax=Curvibacter sp. APW13 TaxID=3077236 RepID=UPI0028DDBECB|nr:PilN domain-containing protein [Curvibacter sp. APW13]MDT8990214.1 PilN domain-containing protein [Curvibacter sp. APW13]